MFEVFFVLTTMYVSYVVFTALGVGKDEACCKNQKKEKLTSQPTTVAESASSVEEQAETTETIVEEPVVVVAEELKAEPVVEKVAEHTQATAEKVAPVKKTTPAKTATAVQASLRNPKTGEVSKMNSYPFTKRWIKEALVSEGLLDKIYTNAELNDAINVKIKHALETLKDMPNYKA